MPLYLRYAWRHLNILVIEETFKYYLTPRRLTYTRDKCYSGKSQMWILFWLLFGWCFETKQLIAVDSVDNMKREKHCSQGMCWNYKLMHHYTCRPVGLYCNWQVNVNLNIYIFWAFSYDLLIRDRYEFNKWST